MNALVLLNMMPRDQYLQKDQIQHPAPRSFMCNVQSYPGFHIRVCPRTHPGWEPLLHPNVLKSSLASQSTPIKDLHSSFSDDAEPVSNDERYHPTPCTRSAIVLSSEQTARHFSHRSPKPADQSRTGYQLTHAAQF